MPKGRSNLATMGIEALIKLRDEIGSVLSQKASDLKKQLQWLETGDESSSRGGKGRRGRPRKGMKIPPKYRDSKDPSLVWAGRGVRPRWMQERIKAGAKQEDFLIAQPGQAGKARRKSAKRVGRRKKAS
jgi:DNA-binding protein H-NS